MGITRLLWRQCAVHKRQAIWEEVPNSAWCVPINLNNVHDKDIILQSAGLLKFTPYGDEPAADIDKIQYFCKRSLNVNNAKESRDASPRLKPNQREWK